MASQALHGFCFSCFFAAGFIYVDRICADDIKSSAQTVFGMIILGLGPLLSGPCMGLFEKMFMGDEIMNYQPFYYTLAAVGLAAAIGFGVMFREEAQSEPAEGSEQA